MYPFEVGKQYARDDVFVVLGMENPRGGAFFTGYANRGDDTTPVEVLRSFSEFAQPAMLAEEIGEPDKIFEGAKKVITVNVYERDRGARLKCIAHWGCTCAICGFDFAAVYGELGAGFIHVHHLQPLGEIGGEYQLNPVSDLRPVCPNCHAMLHRTSPAQGIDELRLLVQSRKRCV